MRILLIDDHALFRVGLQGLLEQSQIDVVGAAGSGEEGLRLVAELDPDIILLDMRIPDMNGVEILKELKQRDNTIPVVMLTTSDDEQDLLSCLRNGAQGYLLKDMEPEELIQSLHDVMQGKTIVAPDLTSALARAVQDGDRVETEIVDDSPFSSLTPRELEILTHLAEGQSNKLIARDLGISIGTVKLHVKAILRKLNVHSRVEAAVMAVENGINRTQK